MSKLAVVLCAILAIGFTACAKTPQDDYYDRATKSSNESLKSLDDE